MVHAPPGTPVVAGRLTRLDRNRLSAEIDAPGPGLIVIAEAYFSAWSATINGDDAPIVPANVMFRGLAVDRAGHYEIEMRLRPPRFLLLLLAYVAARVVLGLALAWRRRAPGESRAMT